MGKATSVVCALLLLLLATLCWQSLAQIRRPNVMCCHREQFIWRKIPASKIQSHRNTPSLCSRKAVILVQKSLKLEGQELSLIQDCRKLPVLGYSVPTSCCFTYQTRPIPRNLIASIYITSSSCSQPGVIVVTKKGKQLCADPRQPWVQERLKHFQSPPN
ncbi:hypothetical protein WISP_127512 [Willisornis vidua]|uniref:Chemokine interleukin-8-like domain-containing protein n=1 Tax=Willisornis vidua TaxID=1566151 RepID=A0ABQ9CRM5_9PASS|nr:hypothetical protein WISP_127512 [Willisornis vidua]